MKQIATDLYIGSDKDYADIIGKGWAVVHACKEPYHRRLLGYTSRGADKNDPEYLFAQRGDILYLNLVDAHDAKYIPKKIIDVALEFIALKLGEGHMVLVHCNKGGSRAAVIGMLFLNMIGYFGDVSFEQAEKLYKDVYPMYSPGKGMRDYAIDNWNTNYNKENK